MKHYGFPKGIGTTASSRACTTLFGLWLRNERLSREMSIIDFAEEVGYSFQTQSNIELGRQHPNEKNRQSIADFLGCSLDFINAKVEESIDYLLSRGKEGIEELVAGQPRFVGTRSYFIRGEARDSFLEKKARGFLRFNLSREEYDRLRQIKANHPVHNKSLSSIISEGVRALLESGYWAEYENGDMG